MNGFGAGTQAPGSTADCIEKRRREREREKERGREVGWMDGWMDEKLSFEDTAQGDDAREAPSEASRAFRGG